MPEIPVTWPPDLAAYKTDLKLAAEDDRWDDALQASLDAAVEWLQETRTDVNWFDESDPDGLLRPVTMRLILGCLRYARRLDIRRETPLSTLIVAELGSANVSTLDFDIDKLTRTGRYARIRFA